MSDAPSLSKIILGSLVMKPALLETADVSEADFSADREKKVFKIIAEIWEDKKPDEIDSTILAERLGGDGAATFVGELTTGLQHLSPEMFVGRVQELKKRIISRRLACRLQKELATESKTGGPMDLTEILQDVDEIRRLQQPKDVNVIGLEKIMPKSISWLWPGRIPKSMLTLCCGDPGVGKSFCTIALASKCSRKIALPDSQISTGCSSLFILGEDPIAEAVRPRADANGADCSKIIILQEPDFHLTDIAKVRWIIERNKDIGLIVIDPLTAFFPAKTRYFEDTSVRTALLPLAGFAEDVGIAVVLVAHFRKAEAEAAIHRVAGSIGLAGIARSILAVTRDEDDPERRLLMSLKANYSRRPPGLAFRIIGEGMEAKIVFEDKPVEADAEDILISSEKKEEAEERNFSDSWLRDLLQDSPQELGEIKKAARETQISFRTLFRSAKRLRVISKTQGFGKFKTTSWEFPS